MTDYTRIGAAVIGTGFIGTVHVEALRRLGVCLRGVLGSRAERGAQQAAVLGVGRAYGALDEMLADPSVQVVHVTSPNVAHYSQIMAILGAGKHVICEKPLAMTSAQSAEMVALAKALPTVSAPCSRKSMRTLTGVGGRIPRLGPALTMAITRCNSAMPCCVPRSKGVGSR